MHAGKHRSGVTPTELKHGRAVRRIRSDVIEVVAPTKANRTRLHARVVQLRPEWVGPVTIMMDN